MDDSLSESRNGFVVRLKITAVIIRRNNLIENSIPFFNPSKVGLKNKKENITLPGVKKK